MDEVSATAKLLKTFHLNSVERKLLPTDGVKISVIKEIIQEKLKITGWFPAEWRPDLPFQGGLLELQASGKINLYKKTETSYMTFQVKEKKEYSDYGAAIVEFMKYMFGKEIDGIMIDYNS